MTCHICLELGRERAAGVGFLCEPCFTRTREILFEIHDLYYWISDAEYLVSTREPASHYTKSKPPVSLHAVSLLDPRSKYQRKGDPISAHRVLKAWAQAVADSKSPSGKAEWVGPVRQLWWFVFFLSSNLNWIAEQAAAPRFARHMAAVLHSLKQEVGDTKEEEEDADQ